MSENFEKTLLAEMLSTRFCHDMAGPVSAINNGLEFLFSEDDKKMQAQAKELLQLSAKEALAKLQVYRMAYGKANAGSESDVKEFEAIVRTFFEHGKVKLIWSDTIANDHNGKISNEMRRILINMITTVAGMLIYGGELAVYVEKVAGNRHFYVTGKHDKIKNDPEIVKIINGGSSQKEQIELTPHNVPIYFLIDLARKKNIQLAFEVYEGKVVFCVHF